MVWNNKSQTIVLLLGGCESVRANPLYQFWTPERIDGSSDLPKKERKAAIVQLEKEIRLWETDFSLFQDYFISKGCSIYGSYPTKPREYKAHTIEIIKSFFDIPSKVYVLYWSGHTRISNKGWCFAKQETLHLPEILSLFRAVFDPYKEERTLIIIGDTCCSGSWCTELNDMEEYELNVIIQAGCLENEQSFVVEGHKPRSNLMQKIIQDHQLHTNTENNNNVAKKEDEEPENTVWKDQRQHPTFAVSRALLEKNCCQFLQCEQEQICLFENFQFFQVKLPSQ